MIAFILRRVLGAIPVLLIICIITFALMHTAPGGPFDQDKAAPPEVIEQLNKRYKLDQPVYAQFYDYLSKIVIEGDFGPSFKYPGRSVNELIGAGFPVTFELGLYALLFALLIGVLSGVYASLHHNTLRDYMPMAFAMTGISVPSLLLGPLLVLIFAIWLGVLPVKGWDTLAHKILPSITLGAAYAAYIARLSRSGMLETLTQDFIRTARAKGVPERFVVLRQALRGAILPVISYLGPAAAGLLAGSFIVETVFQIPGLGRFYVQAAFNRDYTMIMGTTIFISTLIVVFNLLADVIQIYLNPRLSFRSARGGAQ